MATHLLRQTRLNSVFQYLMSLPSAMVGCFILLFLTGPVMARLARTTLLRGELYEFHKAMGVLVLGLLTWRIMLLLRVWWRKYTRHLPRFTRAWVRQVVLHTMLYIFMVAVPLSGLFFSNSFRSGNVRFLGMPLPDLFPFNPELVGIGRSLHFWLAYTFLCLILLHLMAQGKVVRASWRRWQTRLWP